MGYSRENYKRVKEQYQKKRARALMLATQRRIEIEEKIPNIAEIDTALAKTAAQILCATLGNPEARAKIEQMQRENTDLQNIRGDLLERGGYPRDYTAVKYECEDCADTGYTDGALCPCMKRALALAGYESSGMAGLMKTQQFETFSLSYYQGEERAQMKDNFEKCCRFAAEFGKLKTSNLLFYGSTGTGKTHLSTAIAKTVIDRGFDVVYETAQNLFSDFENDQFHRTAEAVERATVKYFNCDLLIVDDLGTEMSTQFTVSCLYNLINTRINHGKGTIISTNLVHKELGERYGERVLSRFMGEYQQLPFRGNDIRMEKLRRG